MSDTRNPQIYVGNLPHDIRISELRDEFEKFGKIMEINIKRTYAFIVSTLIT